MTKNTKSSGYTFLFTLLLFFLYSIGTGLRLGAAADSRVLESFAALLLGISAYLGWYYAYRKGNLVAEEVSVEKSEELLKRNLAWSRHWCKAGDNDKCYSKMR